MHSRSAMRLRAAPLVLVAIMGIAACDRQTWRDVPREWSDAQERWHTQRDPDAWRAWDAIDATTPEGREAHRLLAEADTLYREGIARVDEGDPDARRSFEDALLLAPMDPRLNLPLARAFRRRADLDPENPHLFIRAAFTYRKFLLLVPEDPDAAIARRELEQLDPEAAAWLDALGPEPQAASATSGADAASWLALASLVLALIALVLLMLRPGRRVRSLEELASSRPELHPAIAYLVSGLRHELLKHRIGAVASAVEALAEGRASVPQREFVSGRLFGGEPLRDAWEGHLRAFERALGPELDLHRRDREFARAGKAIVAIAKLEGALRAGDAKAMAKLRRAHEELRALDRRLASLVAKLVRTHVDAGLLRDVVDEVRKEYAPSRVALDALAIEAPDPAPAIEVFRVDLVLVLKNVVRNAILAVGRAEAPRRIRLDVRTELEPTGEENVVIRVHDTSPDALTTEAIYERRVGSGLGLVTAALSRYDGAIVVEPGETGWAKAVALRFFRVYDEGSARVEAA
ncbi:hypothetical protein [Sandaracinus amylolyticus]|uniref:hypothetical protein n=1 Tax=Sandaracinus amylolyticus TaxID=927083 RepID=UPI001F46CF89|nr:hypothetical protein [Sandaracinus amylolyticus]